jgi:hypothetical protein
MTAANTIVSLLFALLFLKLYLGTVNVNSLFICYRTSFISSFFFFSFLLLFINKNPKKAKAARHASAIISVAVFNAAKSSPGVIVFASPPARGTLEEEIEDGCKSSLSPDMICSFCVFAASSVKGFVTTAGIAVDAVPAPATDLFRFVLRFTAGSEGALSFPPPLPDLLPDLAAPRLVAPFWAGPLPPGVLPPWDAPSALLVSVLFPAPLGGFPAPGVLPVLGGSNGGGV